MSKPSHTLDASCRLAPLPQIPNEDGLPPITPQFFYSSVISIDESLPASRYAGRSDTKSVKTQLRPFARGDNNALERAWASLLSEDHRKEHDALARSRAENGETAQIASQRRRGLVESLAKKHLEQHGASMITSRTTTDENALPEIPAIPDCCPSLRSDIQASLQLEFCAVSRQKRSELALDNLSQDVAHALTASRTPTLEVLHNGNTSSRAEAHVDDPNDFYKSESAAHSYPHPSFDSRAVKDDGSHADVVVGASRLHKVSLLKLHMEPLYWSPINDVAVVTRATWFYRDTMMPVAPLVANQLEAGFQELRPWTETWRDELRCAIEVGPAGEEKVSHCLWPQDSESFNPNDQSRLEPQISMDPFCAARCFGGGAAAQGTLEVKKGASTSSSEKVTRPFTNYHVIYKDSRQAFLLKSTLKPSAYYGRKPVLKIAKGITVGIPVLRGFDRQVWIHAQQSRQVSKGHPVDATDSVKPALDSSTHDCEACEAAKASGQVTDLVLVAHGIGQKIAERVESFHFTHAINSFRHAVNVEMGSPIVQRFLREDQNGVMILPLNWRMGLSFEDGSPSNEEENEEYRQEPFKLKDIEPNTIPAIRSMISDVMFDIPFYMSHHKAKMINALVSEANRVYRLWCRNNPGFQTRGRVHLIAHSLGSVMAVDILSRQPTEVPEIDHDRTEPGKEFFEFNTTNLFLVGSPAGFFLLLERGALTPRRGRRKPGCNLRDVTDGNVVCDAGRFGCLAVDNIYNVLAKEDPIAYLLNGAVDPTYAAGLKTAYVPSTYTSLFKSMGDAVRQIVPGLSPSPDSWAVDPERPQTMRLPSQVELEVHDFTREEIAEKRAFLLNDNGQIDWFLRSGSGPLELQYLNMLSAHTSYWINQDFIRMLCMEIGRPPGRDCTIPGMTAVKSTKRFSTV